MNAIRVFLLVLGLAVTPQAGTARDTVMIGEPSWLGARIMAQLIGQILAERFDVEPGYVPRANAGIFAAMDAGRGVIDIHPDVWLPNQEYFIDLYAGQHGTVLLSEGGYEGRGGFCMPRGFAEKHELRSIIDLLSPRIAGQLDTDGDGRDDIWIGEEGWASTNIHRVKMRDYGLGKTLHVNTEAERVFVARLVKIAAAGEGAVFYCYTPHYLDALLELTLLEEPEYDAASYRIVTPDQDADWLEKSHAATADPGKRVVVAYSKALKMRLPRVAGFLRQMDMDGGDLSRLILEVEMQNRSIPEVVAEWVAENGAVLDAWAGGGP